MAYKPKPIKTTVAAAIGDAFSAIEELASEMRETADNMEGANMGHMPKCEAAGSAADELENLSQPDDPTDVIGELEVVTTELVNKDKRKGQSRDVRLQNAQSLLQGAISALEEADFEKVLGGNESDVDGKSAEDLKEEAEQLASDLDEAANVSVEFPGMYG